MVTKNPLRLIEIDAIPPDGNEAGAPVAVIAEHDAITRKVSTLPAAALDPDPAPPKKQWTNWRTIIPGATVGAMVVAFTVAMLTGTNKPPVDRPAPGHPAPGHPAPAPVAPPVTQPAPTAAAAPPAKPAPTVIRVAIDADPAEAELSLDGNVLSKHRLRLEVPRDRGVHVVSASAPGYLPFNQHVSFSNDVVLTIRLRRTEVAPVHVSAKPRPSHSEARRRAETRPAPAPTTSPRPEPGMRLDAPPPRPSSMPIDEKNPYKP
jgi:hypothetical protein